MLFFGRMGKYGLFHRGIMCREVGISDSRGEKVWKKGLGVSRWRVADFWWVFSLFSLSACFFLDEFVALVVRGEEEGEMGVEFCVKSALRRLSLR
jgi:hypothetical protein